MTDAHKPYLPNDYLSQSLSADKAQEADRDLLLLLAMIIQVNAERLGVIGLPRDTLDNLLNEVRGNARR